MVSLPDFGIENIKFRASNSVGVTSIRSFSVVMINAVVLIIVPFIWFFAGGHDWGSNGV